MFSAFDNEDFQSLQDNEENAVQLELLVDDLDSKPVTLGDLVDHVLVASSTMRPNTVCTPSRCGVAVWVTKNWLPPVLGPAWAIDRVPGKVLFRIAGVQFHSRFGSQGHQYQACRRRLLYCWGNHLGS